MKEHKMVRSDRYTIPNIDWVKSKKRTRLRNELTRLRAEIEELKKNVSDMGIENTILKQQVERLKELLSNKSVEGKDYQVRDWVFVVVPRKDYDEITRELEENK